MALTIAQFNALPNNNVGFHEIADSVTNIIGSPLYAIPVVGPILQGLITSLVGNGQATITALVSGTGGIAALTPSDISSLAGMGTSLIDPGADSVVATATALLMGGSNISFVDTVVTTATTTASQLNLLNPTEILNLGNSGVDLLDPVTDTVLPMATAILLGQSGVGFVDSVLMTVQTTIDDLSTLSPTDITDLLSTGTDLLDPLTGGTIPLDVAQLLAGGDLAFVDDVVMTVQGTLSGLTPAEITDLADLGIDLLSGGGIGDAVGLTVEQLTSIFGNGLSLDQLDINVLLDTGANIANMTLTTIYNIVTLLIDVIDVADGTVFITVEQAKAFAQSNTTFEPGDTVVILDTGANIEALTLSDIAAIASINVDEVNAISNQLSLSLAQISAFGDASISFATGDAITVADTGANILALTSTEIADLGALGITAVDATDDVLILTFDTLQDLQDAGIALTSSDVVTLQGLAADFETLTGNEIDNLVSAGVDFVDATDNAVELSLAQAQAFAAGGLAFAVDDIVSVVDTGNAIAALTTGEIADLADAGVDRVDATNDAVSLSISQAGAFAIAGLAFASNDVVTLIDTGANVANLAVLTIAALDGVGVDAIDLTNNAATLGAAQAKALVTAGITFAANDVVTLADTGSGIATLTAQEIGQLATTGFDAIDVTNNLVSLSIAQLDAFSTAGIAFAENDVLKLADTGAHIMALSVDAIGDLVIQGADSIDVTDNAVSLTVAQARAFVSSGLAFATGDVVKIADTGANVATLTVSEINDIKDIGLDLINASDNLVSISLAQYEALGSIAFAAEDVVKVIGTNARDTITAQGGHTSLYGGKGADTLTGGADHAILSGGKGRDKLFGGQGEDTFLFDARARNSSMDRIKDFDAAEDHIALDHSIFKKIGGTLERSEFHAGRAAHDGSDHLIYDKQHGTLYYDKDGSGGHDAVKIAQLDHGVKLNIGDFEII